MLTEPVGIVPPILAAASSDFVGQLGSEDLRVGLVEIAGVVIHGNDPLFARNPF